MGYALLTWCWRIARPFGAVFVTLGQQSLAAFIMQVYVVLLVERLPLFQANNFWINTLAQLVLLASMVALLKGAKRVRALHGFWRRKRVRSAASRSRFRLSHAERAAASSR